jgi:hypothetical protein
LESNSKKEARIFLNFKNKFNGKKISYAADSTVKEVDREDTVNLRNSLNDFSSISVRNDHTFKFVKSIIDNG